MAYEPPRNPWDNFTPVGDASPRKGHWTAWLWLMLGTSMIGAFIGMYFWYRSETYSPLRSERRELQSRGWTEEDTREGMEVSATYGAIAGAIFGAGLWGASLLKKD